MILISFLSFLWLKSRLGRRLHILNHNPLHSIEFDILHTFPSILSPFYLTIHNFNIPLGKEKDKYLFKIFTEFILFFETRTSAWGEFLIENVYWILFPILCPQMCPPRHHSDPSSDKGITG